MHLLNDIYKILAFLFQFLSKRCQKQPTAQKIYILTHFTASTPYIFIVNVVHFTGQSNGGRHISGMRETNCAPRLHQRLPTRVALLYILYSMTMYRALPIATCYFAPQKVNSFQSWYFLDSSW